MFVDRDKNSSHLNQSVIDVAQELFISATRRSEISSSHLGPGKAMLRALDWVFQYEEIVLVLEDDVFPNKHAAVYWETVNDLVLSRYILATSRSPFRDESTSDHLNSGLSKYALTNGWIITRQIWQDFQKHQTKPLFNEFIKFVVKQPLLVRSEHFFFLAASILGRRGIVPAWDSQFIFFVLLNKIKTITPNKSCVEVRGVDAVASNTLTNSRTTDEIFWRADDVPPAAYFPNNRLTNAILDKEIKSNIYKIRWWHIFSPIKSLLRVLKHHGVNPHKV